MERDFYVIAPAAAGLFSGGLFSGPYIRHESSRVLSTAEKNVVTFLNINLGFEPALGNQTRPQIDILVASCEM